jgi:predicted dehydrogenase
VSRDAGDAARLARRGPALTAERTIRAAFVGAGDVAQKLYAPTLAAPVEFAGATDPIAERARDLVERYGGRQYGSLEEILGDDSVDVVVVLTPHDTHEPIARTALLAGKHVFCEKPLALTYEGAQGLVDLARERSVRLGAAPSTFLGEAQQTARALIGEGRLGQVRVVYAEVNWGRIESWHRAPEPFYEAGPLFDVGVYPLTVLASILGPARRACGVGTVLMPARKTLDGRAFEVHTPDFSVALIDFDGVLVRLTTNFYVGHHNRQKGLEFHGDDASLHVSWYTFNSPVEVAPFDGEYEAVAFGDEPSPRVELARGLNEMAESIIEGRRHRASGEQAAHVVEIMCAIGESWKDDGRWVPIASTFA